MFVKKLRVALLALAFGVGLSSAADAAASFNKFNLFVDNLAKGTMNLNSDVIKSGLSNTAPVATNTCYSDVSGTELANGNGYTTGGATVPSTSLSNASGLETLNAGPSLWTSNTGTMGPFRYIFYYDSTPSGCKPLIGWYDNGSSISLNGVNGDTFTNTPTGGALLTLQ